MKQLLMKSFVVVALAIPALLNAQNLKGLNIIMTSPDAQTQMMGMVLATMTLKKHQKEVTITLCGPAGALAVKGEKSALVKRPGGAKAVSPKMALKGLIKAGAHVALCPLYLPNAGKDASVLLPGITIAKPPLVAKKLINADYNNISF
ncbi:hypothetical protein [Sulfurospirillum sp. 1612]|uniref:hypothetical protein n=1 Tax=Sulfurospirillum sp. 1612 TaxID=3094835 RepID=UPI002F92052C